MNRLTSHIHEKTTPTRTLNIPKNPGTLQRQLKKMLNQSRFHRSRLKNSNEKKTVEYPKIRELVARNMIDESSDDFITKFRNLNKRNNLKFKDNIFPPDQTSLGRFKNLSLFWQNFQESFKNISFHHHKFSKNREKKYFKLSKNFDPFKLRNNTFPDSKLLNVLKCLTTQKGLIKRIFDYGRLQKSGIYSVWLNINGLWKSVIIDDFFPFQQNKKNKKFSKFTFLHSEDYELYPTLIEKSLAKYAKSYSNLYKIDQYNQNAFCKFLNCLTGCSIEKISLEENSNLNKFESEKKFFEEELDKIWLRIRKGLRENHLLVLKYSNNNERNWRFKMQNCKNFLLGEGYVITDAEIVYNIERKMERIIKVRNVMNQDSEWKGRWSKNCINWTPELKDKLGFNLDGGEPETHFWASLEDISLIFEQLLICEVHPLGMFNSADLIVDFDHGEQMSKRKMIKVQIMKDSNYKFEIFLLRGKAEEKGQLVSRVEEKVELNSGPMIRFMIGKFFKGNFKFIDFKISKKNFLTSKKFLNEGEYIILVEFNSICSDLDTATFTTYGEYLTDIGIFTFKNTDKQLPLSMYYNFVEYRILKNYILLNAKDAEAYKDQKGVNIVLKNRSKTGDVYELPLSCLRLEDFWFLIVPNRFNTGQIIEAKILKRNSPLFVLKGAQLQDRDTQILKILPQNFEFCYIKNHDFYNFSEHQNTQITWNCLGIYGEEETDIDPDQVKIYKFLLKSRPLQNNLPVTRLKENILKSGYSDISHKESNLLNKSCFSNKKGRSEGINLRYRGNERRHSFHPKKRPSNKINSFNQDTLNISLTNNRRKRRYNSVNLKRKRNGSYRSIFEKTQRSQKKKPPMIMNNQVDTRAYRPLMDNLNNMKSSEKNTPRKNNNLSIEVNRFSSYTSNHARKKIHQRAMSAPKSISKINRIFETPKKISKKIFYTNPIMLTSDSKLNSVSKKTRRVSYEVKRRIIATPPKPAYPLNRSNKIFKENLPQTYSLIMKSPSPLKRNSIPFKQATVSRLVPRVYKQVTPTKNNKRRSFKKFVSLPKA